MISENKINISNLVESGKKYCEENPFYGVLCLFLQYYFCGQKEFPLMKFMKDVTRTEEEFKVFMVFREYALSIYFENFLKTKDSIENIMYAVISTLKTSYDKDKSVLSPYINSITENVSEIIEKYNYIKNSYIPKLESIEKFKQLETAIFYLEEAKKYEEKAKECNIFALEHLKDIQSHFQNNFLKVENKISNILTIENKKML
jgi:hypothetical protein